MSLRPISKDRNGQGEEFLGNLADPEATAHFAELNGHLTAALVRLPTALRQVFELKELEGLKSEQIAQRMGCSAGTVKSRLYRARQHLIRQLAPYV